MCSTCNYAENMPTMIQLRHVPDDLHRKLKARAAMAGMSLSDYLIREVQRIAERPTLDEFLARVARSSRVELGESTVDAVRGERDSR